MTLLSPAEVGPDAARTIPPIERLANVTRLEHAVQRMTSDEPTLSDISTVLYLIGTHDGDVDPMRAQALCYLAARALGKFDADTRCAPPSELAEVVKDARQGCANDHRGCVEYVLPWIFNGRHCSPTCESQDLVTRP